jgi:PAS domain S-box-containing protein
VAAHVGLHAAFALPIMQGRRVQGAMEFFSQQILQPSPDLLNTMTTVCNQIAIYIERLWASEDFDRFFTLSLDMFCVATFEGYFLRLNPAWESVLGFSKDELRASPFVEFVHPDDREATIRELSKIATGGACHQLRKPLSHEGRILQVAAVVRIALHRAGTRLCRGPRCDGTQSRRRCPASQRAGARGGTPARRGRDDRQG